MRSIFLSFILFTTVALPTFAQTPGEPNSSALRSPSVRAALALPRNNPSDYIVVIEALVVFDATQQALPIVDELLALDLDDDARADLVAEIGTARLLKLARLPELPAGMRTFVEQTIAGSAKVANSQERISDLIGQLRDPSTSKQKAATARLVRVGKPALSPLMAALDADDTPESAKRAVAKALLLMGSTSEPALMAAFATGRDSLKSDVANLLVRLRVTQVAGPLAAAASDPSADEQISRAFVNLAGEAATAELAERLLQRSIERAVQGVPVFRPLDGQITLYRWLPEAKQLRQFDLSVADANLMRAAYLAGVLAELKPQSVAARDQATRLQLEANYFLAEDAKYSVDLAAMPIAELLSALQTAGDRQQATASVAILQELAARNDKAVLASVDNQPGPVALSMKSPSPAVRLAAVDLVAKLDPEKAFAGSSYLSDAVSLAVTAHGRRLALGAAPQLDSAVTWVGSLAASGYEGQAVATGQQLIDLAKANVDAEQIWIDMNIGRPVVREVVFQLRRMPASAHLPIVLIARENQIHRARAIANEHERVIARLRPHSPEVIVAIGAELATMLPREWPTAEERLTEAADAAKTVQQLLSSKRDFYRLRAALAERASEIDPLAFGETGWQALAAMGTLESQRSLAAYASRAVLSDAQREQALAGLSTSINRFGVLLTTDLIQQQYDSYNRALAADRKDIAILGKVLDAIEAPRRAQLKAATAEQ